MLVYVINLKRRQDRHDRVKQHLVGLGLTPVFIDAVDGASTSQLPVGTLVNPGQYGCFMSHIRVFETFLDQNSEAFSLVLEDDVILNQRINWSQFLTQLEIEMEKQSLDFLQLGFISAFYTSGLRHHLRNLSHRRVSKSLMPSSLDGLRYLRGTARAGTHCYVISRRFADAARHLNQPVWLPADGFIDRLASSSAVTRRLRMGCLTRSIAEQENSHTLGMDNDSDTAPKSEGVPPSR